MEKLNTLPVEEQAAEEKPETGYANFCRIAGKICQILFHLRKVVLAAPVVYYALRIAAYNQANLPQSVGLLMQADGTYAYHIARQLAVMGPLCLTAGCLVLMCCSRKALYAWAISVFTLALPILLYLSNVYPA